MIKIKEKVRYIGLFSLLMLLSAIVLVGCGGKGDKIIQVAPPVPNSTLLAYNGEITHETCDTVRSAEYIPVKDFEYLTLKKEYVFQVYCYSQSNQQFVCLGHTGWIYASISRREITDSFRGCSHIKVIVKQADSSQLLIDAADLAAFSILNEEEFPVRYGIGTITWADGKDDTGRNTRFYQKDYISLEHFFQAAVSKEFHLIWFAYAYDEKSAQFQYLGAGDWNNRGYFSRQELFEAFPEATHFRFAVKGAKEDFALDSNDDLEAMILKANVKLFTSNKKIPWELGTLSQKKKTLGEMSNVSVAQISNSVVFDSYLNIDRVSAVDVAPQMRIAWFAYDGNHRYQGCSDWFGANVSFATSDIKKLYPDTQYFKIALKAKKSETLDYSDQLIVFRYNKRQKPTSFGYAINHNDSSQRISYTQCTTLERAQDGALYGKKLLIMQSSQQGKIYDVNTQAQIATVRLTGNLLVHSNSVCFGMEKYDAHDDFPMLYCNVYNSYQNNEDRKEGTCGVFRLVKTDSGVYTGELIQVIIIDFVDNLSLWKSMENNGDIRSYGNFTVDADHNQLYAAVPRDKEQVMRFFSFNLPKITDGTYNDELNAYAVHLKEKDIVCYFDSDYVSYPQGMCFDDGKIYSLEGMADGLSASLLQIIDVKKQTLEAVIDLDDMGIAEEPEMIDVKGNNIYLTDISGHLFLLTSESAT